MLPSAVRSEGGIRSQANAVYGFQLIDAIRNAPEAIQRAIWGCSISEIESGAGVWPPGYKGCASEIGRYIVATNADGETLQLIAASVAQAREKGIGWSAIKAHYRNLRLGKRPGSVIALARHLERALLEYSERFPATTDEEKAAALQILTDAYGEDKKENIS